MGKVSVKVVTSIFKAARPHQWVKNTLLAIPLLVSHHRIEYRLIVNLVEAFLAFSFVASAIYLFNDIVDIKKDREHPIKKNRVIARGDVTIPQAVTAIIFLLAVGFSLGAQLSLFFAAMLLFYIVLNIFYSFWLKNVAILNALLLTTFYNWRILSGGLACGILISPWLLGFSSFFFLSLACCKKCADINAMAHIKGERVYNNDDLQFMTILGTASGLISVLVLAIYIAQEEVQATYDHSEFLWFMCLAFFYWIVRQWLITARQKMMTDPVLFAVKDPVTYLIGSLVLVILYLAV